MAAFFKPTGQSRLINLDLVTHIDFNEAGLEIVLSLASEASGIAFLGIHYPHPNAYATDTLRLQRLVIEERLP